MERDDSPHPASLALPRRSKLGDHPSVPDQTDRTDSCGRRPSHHRLKKTLTAWDLTCLGIGAIIGTGIFVLIGTAIVGDAHRPGAGPGIILSFILSGLTCALAALCYAEMSDNDPGRRQSPIPFRMPRLGELLAWMTGWNLILEYGVACVAVAIGWSGYFNNLLQLAGLELPYWATHPPGGADGGVANFPAAIIVFS